MAQLVTFFSATGTTRRIAEALARAAQADLAEITPAEPYTAADLNWRNKQSRSSIEMDNEASRPAITDAPCFDGYDVVFVGFPIWWYREPSIIDTLLDAERASTATIVPFATSGGSPVEGATAHLRALYPELNIADGRLLNKHPEDSELAIFAKNHR